MMAAEPTPHQSVQDTATPAVLRANDGTPDGVQHVPADAPAGHEAYGESSAAIVDRLVNDIVDEVVNSTEVSISGGSDTEASRPDTLKKDEKGHSRTSSSKKPTTFKSVSVNKTFLASKATSNSSTPKIGEKPTTPVPSAAAPAGTSSAAKPRLVAKTGNSLRDGSKSSLSQNGRPAPDGNAVWNKNRPVPPPDPKKFTDEELARIGIHMANRLHPDTTKGQSTWADIDDDDEDWAAPEAITWTDGTKTTIPHVDEAATTPELPAVKEIKPVEKPSSPAPPSTTGSPSVKPGLLPSGKGLVLKGASSEKPTLVAKPPAPPTPVKSPWATLPPMPKVSPMEVPHEQPQRGFPPASQGFGPKGLPPPAAREIAADDFSRSPRRDNQQLFNSQSGRYEPVSDRRGMARSDFHPRQPAVLQRPSLSETQGPAEPSAAFQTTHTSGGGYGRRRGSSNVSGGSGSFQRMARPYDQAGPPPEIPNARRNSFASASEQPSSPHNLPPSGPPAAPRQPGPSPFLQRVSPAMSFSTPQVPSVIDPATGPAPAMNAGETTVQYQQRLMKERREAAIRRRKEKEEDEEQQKRERLAKKLEALGPAPERKSARKDSVKETTATTEPTAETSKPTQALESTDTKAAIEPPSASDENKQAILANGTPSEPQIQPKNSSEQLPTAENKHAHPWQPRMPNQPERIWGPGSQTSRNVWGAPNNDRTLGNGTFNSVPDAQPPQIHSIPSNRPPPGPIGPPRTTAQLPGPPTSSRLGPIGPPQRNGPRHGTDEEKDSNRNRWIQGVMAGDEELRKSQLQKQSELEREMKARGIGYSDLSLPIKDEWRQTNEDGKVIKCAEERTYDNASQGTSPWPVTPGGQQNDRQQTAASNTGVRNGSAGALNQRSRFFPSSRDSQQAESLAPDTGRPKSPSPPPPEMDGSHPAFDGDAAHPHVSLPKTRPIVKLPPSQVSALAPSQRPGQSNSNWGQSSSFRDDNTAQSYPSRSSYTAPNKGFGQSTNNSQILDRIKNLFANKPSSVNSSSRTALVQPSHPASATVSLPGIYAPTTIVDDTSYVTKTMDEDCFEEQEMGSLPPVHLPKNTPDAAWEPAKFPPRQDRKLFPPITTSAEALAVYSDVRNIFIHLPNMVTRKSVVVASSRTPSNPRRSRGSGSRYSSSYRGGNRSRDTPYSPEQISVSGSTTSRGGRSYRGRSEGWGRTAAPAIQTQ